MLAHGEVGVGGAPAPPAEAHAHPLEGLEALPVPLDDLDVDPHRIADAELRAAGSQALTIELVDNTRHLCTYPPGGRVPGALRRAGPGAGPCSSPP